MTTPDLSAPAPDEPVAAPEPITPPPTPWWRRVPRIAWILAAAAILIAAAAVITISILAARSPLEAAVEQCGLTDNEYIALRDEGQTLIVDTAGDESDGADIIELACLAVELDVPDSTMARMESTRALDGIQKDEFDGIEVQWSYHPNDGLDLIFSR